VRGVTLFPSQIEELVLKLSGLAPHYQLELTRVARLDRLAVLVECLEATTAESRQHLERELYASIKAMIGIDRRDAR
jgi:phenylacetate-CoA ligase